MIKYNTINEFIVDESFVNYCLNNNAVDTEAWTRYLINNPDQTGLIEFAKSEVLMLRRILGSLDQEQSLKNFKKNVEKKPVSYFIWNNWIAAAIVFLIFSGGIWFWNNRTVKIEIQDQLITYSTTPAQRKTLKLPDGTVVQLNASSVVSFKKNMSGKLREIKLNGEAYFDVVHIEGRPFVIHVRDMDVKVLGTSFNVKAYDNEVYATASLIRGSIEVTINADNRKVVLKPSQKITISNQKLDKDNLESDHPTETEFKLEGIKYTNTGNIVAETSWTQDKLVFVKEPFEKIVPVLERWYNVKILLNNNQLKQRLYTASFNDEESLDSILRVLQLSVPFSYTQQENVITIKP